MSGTGLHGTGHNPDTLSIMASMSSRTISMLLAAVLAYGCATVPRAKLVEAGTQAECVVLLHGLNRSWRAMNTMAEALQDAGYSTANVDYPSQSDVVEQLAPAVVELGLEQCRAAGADRIHFVTHSMGGILLRFAHEREPIPEIGRVVMLGPPNQGSEVVDKTRKWPGMEIFAGPAGLQLGTDEESIPSRLGPVDFELGVIAGKGSINPLMSVLLPDEDDGKVTVERTKVAGMDDFIVVPDNHHFIVSDDDVIANTLNFLEYGRFLTPSAGR